MDGNPSTSGVAGEVAAVRARGRQVADEGEQGTAEGARCEEEVGMRDRQAVGQQLAELRLRPLVDDELRDQVEVGARVDETWRRWSGRDIYALLLPSSSM
jgi:hypothetical protein